MAKCWERNVKAQAGECVQKWRTWWPKRAAQTSVCITDPHSSQTHTKPVRFQLCNGHWASPLMDIRKKEATKRYLQRQKNLQKWVLAEFLSTHSETCGSWSGEPDGCRSASKETIIAIMSNLVNLNRLKCGAEEKHVTISEWWETNKKKKEMRSNG